MGLLSRSGEIWQHLFRCCRTWACTPRRNRGQYTKDPFVGEHIERCVGTALAIYNAFVTGLNLTTHAK